MGCAALNGINMGPGNGHQTTAGNARMTPMRRQERNIRRGCGLRLIAGAVGVVTAVLTLAVPLSAQRAERPALTITGYVIDAELDTTAHHLTAKTVVRSEEHTSELQ